MKPMRETNHMRLLMQAFESGEELSSLEASEIAFVSPRMARIYLNWMVEHRMIHVARWERNKARWFAIYALGHRRPAKRPAPQEAAARSKNYRESNRKPRQDQLTRFISKITKP